MISAISTGKTAAQSSSLARAFFSGSTCQKGVPETVWVALGARPTAALGRAGDRAGLWLQPPPCRLEAYFGAHAPVKSLSLCSRGAEQIDRVRVSMWRQVFSLFFGK